MNVEKLWEDFTLAKESETVWQCGPFTLLCKQEGVDFLIAPHYQEKKEQTTEPSPVPTQPRGGDKAWSRWAIGLGNVVFHVKPGLPDRPIIVTARRPFLLPPGEKTTLYIAIPIWAKVYARLEQQRYFSPLNSFPSAILSSTWFGDRISGKLAYSLKSRSQRLLDDFNYHPNRAICPVQIHNRSFTALDYHKICLATDQLSIYRDDRGLWTNFITVEYYGTEEGSLLKYKKGPPQETISPKLLTPALQSPTDSFFTRTFGNSYLQHQLHE